MVVDNMMIGCRSYNRRSPSTERDGGDRSRDYSKYNNHHRYPLTSQAPGNISFVLFRQDSRDYKYGRAKDIRDSDRERYGR